MKRYRIDLNSLPEAEREACYSKLDNFSFLVSPVANSQNVYKTMWNRATDISAATEIPAHLIQDLGGSIQT